MAEAPKRGSSSDSGKGTEHNRISKYLTGKRLRKVLQFLRIFKANPQVYPDYQTDAWINALLAHVNDPTILPSHMKHWMRTHYIFKSFHRSNRSLCNPTQQDRNTDSPSGSEDRKPNVQVQSTPTTSAGALAEITSTGAIPGTSNTLYAGASAGTSTGVSFTEASVNTVVTFVETACDGTSFAMTYKVTPAGIIGTSTSVDAIHSITNGATACDGTFGGIRSVIASTTTTCSDVTSTCTTSNTAANAYLELK